MLEMRGDPFGILRSARDQCLRQLSVAAGEQLFVERRPERRANAIVVDLEFLLVSIHPRAE